MPEAINDMTGAFLLGLSLAYLAVAVALLFKRNRAKTLPQASGDSSGCGEKVEPGPYSGGKRNDFSD